MSKGNKTGDLTFGKARIGVRVRCVREPDMSMWNTISYINTPIVGRDYHVRGVTCLCSREGLLLKEISNREKIGLKQVAQYGMKGEPFFPFNCFNFVSSP